MPTHVLEQSSLPIEESLGELGSVVWSGVELPTDTTSLASPDAMVTSVASGEGNVAAG